MLLHTTVLKYLRPVDFAILASHMYELNEKLPSRITYLGDVTYNDIRFGYFEFKIDDLVMYIMAIRGSDNAANKDLCWKYCWNDENKKAHFRETVGSAVNDALTHFKKKYGKCSFVTGHSLGGKATEFVPDHMMCISFNGWKNEKRANLISYRLEGDFADTAFKVPCHTDHWISNMVCNDDSALPVGDSWLAGPSFSNTLEIPPHSYMTVLNCHAIRSVIAILNESDPKEWQPSDMAIAEQLASRQLQEQRRQKEAMKVVVDSLVVSPMQAVSSLARGVNNIAAFFQEIKSKAEAARVSRAPEP